MSTNEQDVTPDRTAAQTPNEASGETSDIQALQAALEAAEAQAAEHRDLYMRALAELDNVRKRAVRDIEQAHKYALERFANDLLPVKDGLELGLSSEANAEALRAGTESTLKLFNKALENARIQEISPQGEVFNPELHEAMIAQPSAEHVPNTVIQVIQKGYQLNGRLLRPARVIVAKEP